MEQAHTDGQAEREALMARLREARWQMTIDIAAIDTIGLALKKRRMSVAEAHAVLARTWPEWEGK